MRPVTFKIEKQNKPSLARAGVLSTPHGDIQTPAFVGVATKATIKGVSSLDFKNLGLQTVIANTYHLYLSPGEDLVEKAGGVGKFMGWNGPTMTDSGGFQVFSLGVGFGKKVSKFQSLEETPSRAKESPQPTEAAVYNEELATSHGKLAIVDEDGVSFTSHLDGTLHRFTPERSVEIQHKLGADIFFAFDECTEPTAPYEYQKEAMERTHRWAKRSLAAHRQNIEANNKQAVYGIAQGGQFDDLRAESAKTIGNMGFDGFGLGGSFSKKYGENSLQSALNMLQFLPPDMPVHGLGVGEPEDLFLGAAYGVDTFDCVIPTRNGRTGTLFTHAGKLNIENAQYKDDLGPLDPECACPVCAQNGETGFQFTRAYIHHLFRTKEMLAPMLASQHNIFFLANLVSQIRESILQGNFEQFRDEFLAKYKRS
ncbi:MAG: tRNA guanosine(34) transglycosylase Tgt [bacterium]